LLSITQEIQAQKHLLIENEFFNLLLNSGFLKASCTAIKLDLHFSYENAEVQFGVMVRNQKKTSF
jgi:hypothetical protein